MQIVKPLTLGVLSRPYRLGNVDYLAVAAYGFFRLGKNDERFLPESEQWARILPLLPGTAIDEVIPKSLAEVLLAGNAHAREGEPVTAMNVRLKLAEIDKTLRVIGPRQWSKSFGVWYQVSEPQPFQTMPLAYTHAWGGPKSTANPMGVGPDALSEPARQGPMPNIAYPEGMGPPAATAGFGPLAVNWSPRRERQGSYGRAWQKAGAYGYPSDINPTAFNVAPQDQWRSGRASADCQQWQGGEHYRLEGMHPQQPVLEGQLPTLRARAFARHEGAAAQAAVEIPLTFDTVWLFPDQERGVAIFHGRIAVSDSDGLDIATLMVAYENHQESRSLEHYRQVLALRTDPVTAGLHAMNESQLAPSYSEAERARRQARRLAEAAQQQAELQQKLNDIDAEFWARTKQTPPADHQPPKVAPPLLPTISREALEEGDYDLTEMVGAAIQLADDIQQKAEAERAKLPAEIPAAPVDPDTQKAAAFELARQVAVDLITDQNNPSVMAQRAELLAPLHQAERDGQRFGSAERAQIEAALLQAPALKRQGRRASPEPLAPAAPLPADIALWLGMEARQWWQGGSSLAGRDLAGIDWRGMDFSGADLREIMLEQADLRGARFVGANLAGAVLSGARLDATDFTDANLQAANLCRSQGRGIRLIHADMRGVQASDANWSGADISGAILDDGVAIKINLNGAKLDGAHLHRIALMEAQAASSRWQHADLDKAILTGANLTGADFSAARLHKVVLMDSQLVDSSWLRSRLKATHGGGKADWSRAVLRGTRADNCSWHGARLVAADLSQGGFMSCDFMRADLGHAILEGSVFSNSIFMQTVLAASRAKGADFFQALCRKTDFSAADLRDTNFVQATTMEAIFTDAQLFGAIFDKSWRAA
ncbi:MAG: DUF2169 domain-containing protein [Betaproteobacteria bacterium]|nr:DUF2169 domain-containing protein [Betaproteobacteria bacterium]